MLTSQDQLLFFITEVFFVLTFFERRIYFNLFLSALLQNLVKQKILLCHFKVDFLVILELFGSHFGQSCHFCHHFLFLILKWNRTFFICLWLLVLLVVKVILVFIFLISLFETQHLLRYAHTSHFLLNCFAILCIFLFVSFGLFVLYHLSKEI